MYEGVAYYQLRRHQARLISFWDHRERTKDISAKTPRFLRRSTLVKRPLPLVSPVTTYTAEPLTSIYNGYDQEV